MGTIKFIEDEIYSSCFVLLHSILDAKQFLFDGGVGKHFRSWCCHHIFKSCGRNINVERQVSFGKGFNIELGDNSGFGCNSHIASDIKVGKNVMMGPECYFLSSLSHNISSVDVPMCEQGSISKGRIVIEDDVWIGLRCIVLPGKTIKNGSILAAGCVYSKDFPEYSIVGGNPARFIRNRKDK